MLKRVGLVSLFVAILAAETAAQDESLSVVGGEYTSTNVLPCQECRPTDLWATATAPGSVSLTITTTALPQVTAVLPCLICQETRLTVLATAPAQLTVPPSPVSPKRVRKERDDNLLQRRQALTKWGNVTMYGFKEKVDLPEGFSYCGPLGNVTKVNVDVESEGNNTLQTAANQCVNYYYSRIGRLVVLLLERTDGRLSQ